MRTMFSADDLIKIRQAKAWRVNEEEIPENTVATVEGVIFAIVPRVGDYGKYPVVIVDTNAGETVAVHAFHHLLFQQLKDIRATPGMDVVFSYAGKREKNKVEKDGTRQQYHDWQVVPSDGAEIDVFDFANEPEVETPDF